MKGRVLLAGLVGLILGAAIGLCASATYYRRSSAFFAKCLRCRTMAEEYIAKALNSPRLDQVDFSPVRNSCVAAMQSHSLGFWNYEVANVVSNETLFNESSLPSRNYGSIPVPEAGPTCDKARFPWHRRCEIRRNV